MSERKNFGKLKEVIPLPNLIENQLNSYVDFLQMDVPPSKRRQVGLHAVFSEIFPIESYDGKHKLEYVSYDLVGPKMSEVECIKEGATYSVALHVTFRLREEDRTQEERIFMGDHQYDDQERQLYSKRRRARRREPAAPQPLAFALSRPSTARTRCFILSA